MDIYQFAIDFERENRKYYEECAENVEDESIKSVFLELSAEEAKHERIVKKLRDKENVEDLDFDIIQRVNEVFSEIKEDKKHEDIIRSIIELVNRPNTWLEDAEWYHLEDY